MSSGTMFLRRTAVLAAAAAGLAVSCPGPMRAAPAEPAAVAGAATGLLTPEQEARLRKFLPRTAPKLQQRQTVNVAVAGDSISEFYQPSGNERYDSSKAWHGRFLSRLASHFFYHGGVVDIDPRREVRERTEELRGLLREWAEGAGRRRGARKSSPPRDLPDVSPGRLLAEGFPPEDLPDGSALIRVHNLARGGALVPQALESLLTWTWGPDPATHPDLVMICYGVNDCNAGNSLAFFREYLREAIRLCRAHDADVILAGPPLILTGDAREALSRTRPYNAVAREVADEAGIFFADLGAALARRQSDLQALTADEAFAAAVLPIRRYFDHDGGVEDFLHINGDGALRAGEETADELLRGAPEDRLQLSGAMEVGQDADGGATLTLRVFNPTDREVTAVVCPMAMTGYIVKPGTPDRLVALKPNQGRRVSFPCLPAPVRNPQTRSDLPPAGEEFVRGAAIVCDDDTQEIVDFRVPLLPVALVWPEGRLDRQAGELQLAAVLVNPGTEPATGSATIEWLGESQQVEVDVPAGERRPFPVRLKLPPADGSRLRFRDNVVVRMEVAGRSLKFERGIEGVRHLGLEERIPLVPEERWRAVPAGTDDPESAGAWLTVSANVHGIYFVIDVPPGAVSGRPDGIDWGMIQIQIDGRDREKNGRMGFVDRLEAPIPWADGPLSLRRIRPATFGETYRADYYDPAWVGVLRAFPAAVDTRPNGARRIEFSVARAVFQQHGWMQDAAPGNSLGLNLHLAFADSTLQGFNGPKTCHLSLSGIVFNDPRSLTALELTRSPAPAWSLRIY